MNVVLAGILVYILLQLLLGLAVSRRIRTDDDYLLAGRSLGYGLATFSIFATWFGAESCVGTAGAAYAGGLAGVSADPFGYAVCLLLMGFVFAVPLWKLKLTTIADFFRRRYSVSAERITAFIMVPASLLWAAAQIRAFGMVLSASSDFPIGTAVTAAAVVVIAYTALGGLLADAITDIVQGAVLILGLIVLFAMVVADAGGIARAAAAVPSDALTFIPQESSSRLMTILTMAEIWAVPICGSVVAQELISRVLASRSPSVARRSSLMAGSLYLCVGLIPLSLGLIGLSLLPTLEHPEQVLPMIAQQHLSTLFYVVFAGALVSAILSTVDSALLAASSILSHNLILSLRPDVPERRKLLISRAGVILLGIAAYVIALHAEGVYELVKDASAFGSGGILVVLVFGLFTRFGGAKSAVATLVAGAVVWGVASYGFGFELSFLLALAVSLLVYVGVGWREGRSLVHSHTGELTGELPK